MIGQTIKVRVTLQHQACVIYRKKEASAVLPPHTHTHTHTHIIQKILWLKFSHFELDNVYHKDAALY